MPSHPKKAMPKKMSWVSMIPGIAKNVASPPQASAKERSIVNPLTLAATTSDVQTPYGDRLSYETMVAARALDEPGRKRKNRNAPGANPSPLGAGTSTDMSTPPVQAAIMARMTGEMHYAPFVRPEAPPSAAGHGSPAVRPRFETPSPTPATEAPSPSQPPLPADTLPADKPQWQQPAEAGTASSTPAKQSTPAQNEPPGKVHPWIRDVLQKLGLEVAKAGTDEAPMPERLKKPLKDKLFVRDARAKISPVPRVQPKPLPAVQDTLDADSYGRVMQFAEEYGIMKRGTYAE
jgi:hypothetical protein